MSASWDLASETFSQIEVPTSTTDCIISRFTLSPSFGVAAASSVSMCERSWPPVSMIWYSSSTPMVSSRGSLKHSPPERMLALSIRPRR